MIKNEICEPTINQVVKTIKRKRNLPKYKQKSQQTDRRHIPRGQIRITSGEISVEFD
jgi:hypothetical protein